MTYFVVANTGPKPCTVGGYPEVRVFRRTGGEIHLRLVRGRSYMILDPGPRRITLQPRKAVYFGFTWSDSNPAPGANVPCPEGTEVRASVGTAVLTTPSALANVCGPMGWVTALANRAAFTGPNLP